MTRMITEPDEKSPTRQTGTICSYTVEEYARIVESFHGHLAPGLMVGGVMVDLALRHLPDNILYDAFCETVYCLPDAVQMLTPCTVGNGWLKVRDLGRYALALYDKATGCGVRVFLDGERLKPWSAVTDWFFKRKPKCDQDTALLFQQIEAAGTSIMGVQSVQIAPSRRIKRSIGERAFCPVCKEVYPARHGRICRACQGDAPYEGVDMITEETAGPALKSIPVEAGQGAQVLHDMTQILPGRFKGAAFTAGQQIGAGDICRLQQMGRRHIYVTDTAVDGSRWVHENEAAQAFAKAIAGAGVTYTLPVKEGKIDLVAQRKGLLTVDIDRLEAFNLIPGVMCATRKGYSLVSKGRKIAGTRAIPLYLSTDTFSRAMDILAPEPIVSVLPLKKLRVGIIVTGTEVFHGLVKDRFIPLISAKVVKLGSAVTQALIVPDRSEAICDAANSMISQGVQLIVTTAGLSVDPDDVTRQGLRDAGAEQMHYGAPILPGAMTLVARIGSVPVIGVPACALYYPTTSLDLLLPRLLAGVRINRRDLARLGHGAYCWQCKSCAYPKCAFGKD